MTDGVYIFNDGERMMRMTARSIRVNNRPIYYDPYIWSPSTDIALWHGNDGLLAKIEEKGAALKFFDTLENIVENQITTACSATAVMWKVRRAEPAQLTAALVKIIKEEE